MVIVDFRGKKWEFIKIIRKPDPGHDGKVWVKDFNGFDAEFYWAVFPDVDFNKMGA